MSDSYMSGYCEDPQGHWHENCREDFPAYGKTPALACVCPCHRLRSLVKALGPVRVVQILEEVLRDEGR